ncbi:MAG: ABC transporter permease subunit [Planctomycetes bacterium]|nr:ABC transporter permease subunit [Planctomycetota bacterium]
MGKRILVVSGIFALALVAGAPYWSGLDDADRVKLVKDISLTAMTFLGVIVAVFISAYSLPSDIEEKRISTVVSKPVRRRQILLGKFCGFLMILAVILAAMGIFSDAVIRAVSTSSRVKVTSAEAPIIADGQVIGAVGKGRELRVIGAGGDYYEVVLPDDLVVEEASIAAADVEMDKTAGQVKVAATNTAALVCNGVTIARVSDATFAIKERLGDTYIVHLPESMRITKALVPAADTSPPHWSLIRAKRIVPPERRVFSNEGRVAYDKDALIMAMLVSSIGEVWHFPSIDAAELPAGQNVRVLLRLPGFYGVVDETNASGRFDQDRIDELDVDLLITSIRQPGRIDRVRTRATWAGSFFAMSFELPREILAGGVDVVIAATRPGFIDTSRHTFSDGRSAAWHFRGLKMNRFNAKGKIRAEVQFNLNHVNLPAHGGRVADVELKVSSPSGGRSRIITVPIRNRKPVEIAFDRDLIDAHGGVDISIHKVPDPYSVGMPAFGGELKLLESPVLFERSYFKAVLLVFCQLTLVGSATLAASTFVSGGVAALVGFFTYFSGLVVSFISETLKLGPRAFAGHHHGAAPVAEGAGVAWTALEPLLKFFVIVVPDVTRLDAKTFILQGLDVPLRVVAFGVGVTLLYAVIFMVLGQIVFWRRELG